MNMEDDGMDPDTFGMRVLTRSLDGHEDTWLVELEKKIRPTLRTYEETDAGIVRLADVEIPHVRHVVVVHEQVHEYLEETVVFPAYASGEIRAIGEQAKRIAGGHCCTHVDALVDLEAGYVGLECTVDGERCHYAMGTNQVLLYDSDGREEVA